MIDPDAARGALIGIIIVLMIGPALAVTCLIFGVCI